MMADDDQNQGGVFSRDTAETAQTVAQGALALAAAVGAGILVRAHELVAIADSVGVARIPVTSSCIAALSYHLESGDMEVTFNDGSVYNYPAVHMADFLRFLNASSKGSYYNMKFRGKENLIQGKKKGSHLILGGTR